MAIFQRLPYTEEWLIPNRCYAVRRTHQPDGGLFRIPPHFHNLVEIICCPEGIRGFVRVDNKTFTVKQKSCVVVIPPGAVHSFTLQSSPGAFCPIVQFSPDYLRGLLPVTDTKNHGEKLREIIEGMAIDQSESFPVIYRHLTGLSQMKPHSEPDPIGALSDAQTVVSLFLHILPQRSARPQDVARPQVQRIVDAIETHAFSPECNLELLATSASMSKFHMCRLFKKYTNHSLWETVQERRLMRARSLLESCHDPVERIAEICGFKSASHFVGLYKRKFGIPPGKWRSSRKEET